MQIQINTSNGIENNESLERWASAELLDKLSHFRADVTRVEVHLSDENGDKSGSGDKRCTMEARLAHHQPVAASHHGATQDEAFRGAADKLKRLVDHTLDKAKDKRDRESIRKDVPTGDAAD